MHFIYIEEEYRRRGYGRTLMEFWEGEMRKQGHGMVITSTQVNETAQHFYRKLGYKDCGGLLLDIPRYEQPMEMFLCKRL